MLRDEAIVGTYRFSGLHVKINFDVPEINFILVKVGSNPKGTEIYNFKLQTQTHLHITLVLKSYYTTVEKLYSIQQEFQRQFLLNP